MMGILMQIFMGSLMGILWEFDGTFDDGFNGMAL